MEEYSPVVLVAGTAILAIVVVAILVGLIRRRRRIRAMHAPLPLIPFSTGRPVPARPDGTLDPSRGSVDFSTPSTPSWSAPVADHRTPQYSRPSYAPSPAPPPLADVTPTSGRRGGPLADALADAAALRDEPVDGRAVDGASMRYWRPADGTLQFLPGRLEVIAGRDAGQEIRFVRTPGPDGTRVTFGRAEGAPYRHVQLREPTVSRAHARMTLENGTPGAPGSRANGPRWRLENLSATNPVVVNGRPLASDGSDGCSVSLGEGDRIEMGEVVFRFHEK